MIGRNEGERLSACLRALDGLPGPVIYADSESTDGSPERAAKHGATVVTLDGDRPLSAARGRNAGFAVLRQQDPACPFVQFIDGDSLLQHGWIDAALSFMASHPRAAVVCGSCVEERPDASIYNWMCNDEWATPVGQADACGGNAMIRTEAFAQVNGFRDDLKAGEEAECMARMRDMGWEVWRIAAPMVVHDANILHFRDWWIRVRRGGYSFANVWTLTRAKSHPLYGNQLRSALVWVIVIPMIVIVLAATVSLFALLALPAVYALQVARVAAQRNWRSADSWRRAAMLMFAKLPETMGVARFFLESLDRVSRRV